MRPCRIGWRATALWVCALGGTGCGSSDAASPPATPKLSLRGTTTLDEAEAAGLTPALVFLSPDGDATVGVRITEDFPSVFRLDVAAAPPANVMLELPPDVALRLGLRGAVAEAVIALLPTDHPRTLPNEVTNNETCDDAQTLCTRTTSACLGDTCRERTYACVPNACEALGSSGTAGPGQGYFTLGIACAGGACYQSTTACSETGACRAEFSRCPFDRTTVEVGFGTVKTCEVLDQTGDASIMTLSDVALFATTHYVTYVAEDNPGFNGLDLVRGYNLVESKLRTPEGYMQAVECATSVEFDVLREYNEANDTTYGPSTAPVEVDVLARDRKLTSCPRPTESRVVLDSLDVPIVLALGPYPGL
jgi:hypothetical protein